MSFSLWGVRYPQCRRQERTNHLGMLRGWESGMLAVGKIYSVVSFPAFTSILHFFHDASSRLATPHLLDAFLATFTQLRLVG